MRHIATAAAAVLLVLALGPAARADCASPTIGFSPPTGTVIPARARVLVFLPAYEATGTLTVANAQHTQRIVAQAPDVVALEVSLLDPTADQVELTYQRGDARTRATYTVGKVSPARAAVLSARHAAHEWTCSRTDVLELDVVGSAIGFRFAWDDGTSDVVPPSTNVMWGRRVDPPMPVQLGHLNCIGYNTDPLAIAQRRGVSLFALYSDGRDERVGTATAKLGPDGVPDFRLVATPAPALAPPPPAVVTRELVVVQHDERPRWILGIAVLAGIVSLLACVVALRRS